MLIIVTHIGFNYININILILICIIQYIFLSCKPLRIVIKSFLWRYYLFIRLWRALHDAKSSGKVFLQALQ